MRIIAGRFRSRGLKSVPGLQVRPTPDRLRESLFSILMPRLEGAVFLDAYAGSGAVGLEALSRGAERVVFIERNARALAMLRENVESLGVEAEVNVVRGSASVLLPNYPADIAFIDPPYDNIDEYTASIAALSRTKCALVIAQHESRLSLEARYEQFGRNRVVKQGHNSLSFYERN